MRFGRDFHRYRVPEWTAFYTDYNYTKNFYNTTRIRAHQDERNLDLTGVLAALNQDLEKVETFYLSRIECIGRKKIMLCYRYGILLDSNETLNFVKVDRWELQDLWTAFRKILEELKILHWYCKVNKTGFSMIVSKMGRFQHMSTGQSNKDLFKFDNAQFVCQCTLLHDFEAIDKTMVKLSEAMSESHDSTSFSMLLQASCSRSYLVFDASEAACLAIRKDAASPLDVILDQHYNSTEANENLGSLLSALLQCSILYNSRRCIESLLSRIRSLEFWATDGTTKLQQLRASLDLPHKLKCGKHQKACAQDFPNCADCDASCQDLVVFLLGSFQPQELRVLIEKDSLGCLLLHNAAASGLAKTCKIYLDYMQDDRHFSVSIVADAVLCRDSEGRTPLYLAVISGSYNVTKTLLGQGINGKANSREMTHESNIQCVLDALLPDSYYVRLR
ncbi:Glycerophosphocholine phosphodiesterase [Xylographa pallens]|nr:Glycerophosphocholine phosphodiesterase [Xylographa pallens]